MGTIDVSDLVELGITEREARIYLVMLDYEVVSVKDLHRLTGIQPAKMYAILNRMVHEGLVHERQEGRKRFFSARSPDLVKEGLVRSWDTAHQRRRDKAELLFDTLLDSFNGSRNGSAEMDLELIQSSTEIHQRYVEMIEAAENEILGFIKPPIVAETEKQLDQQMAAQADAVERGVTQRSIFSLKDMGGVDYVLKTLNDNDHMRVVDQLPAKMFIFDGHTAFFALPSDTAGEPNVSMLRIKDAGICQILSSSFEEVWRKALPIETFSGYQISTMGGASSTGTVKVSL